MRHNQLIKAVQDQLARNKKQQRLIDNLFLEIESKDRRIAKAHADLIEAQHHYNVQMHVADNLRESLTAVERERNRLVIEADENAALIVDLEGQASELSGRYTRLLELYNEAIKACDELAVGDGVPNQIGEDKCRMEMDERLEPVLRIGCSNSETGFCTHVDGHCPDGICQTPPKSPKWCQAWGRPCDANCGETPCSDLPF